MANQIQYSPACFSWRIYLTFGGQDILIWWGGGEEGRREGWGGGEAYGYHGLS